MSEPDNSFPHYDFKPSEFEKMGICQAAINGGYYTENTPDDSSNTSVTEFISNLETLDGLSEGQVLITPISKIRERLIAGAYKEDLPPGYKPKTLS